MWPWTGPWAGCRSPQASAGIPANTRESARSGKKKPQPRTVGVLILVEAAGVERDLAEFSKCLMALGFWANSRQGNGLRTSADFTHVLRNPPNSSVFLER